MRVSSQMSIKDQGRTLSNEKKLTCISFERSHPFPFELVVVDPRYLAIRLAQCLVGRVMKMNLTSLQTCLES